MTSSFHWSSVGWSHPFETQGITGTCLTHLSSPGQQRPCQQHVITSNSLTACSTRTSTPAWLQSCVRPKQSRDKVFCALYRLRSMHKGSAKRENECKSCNVRSMSHIDSLPSFYRWWNQHENAHTWQQSPYMAPRLTISPHHISRTSLHTYTLLLATKSDKEWLLHRFTQECIHTHTFTPKVEFVS